MNNSFIQADQPDEEQIMLSPVQMSFPVNTALPSCGNTPEKNKKKGKSAAMRRKTNKEQSLMNTERASAPGTAEKKKASVTVEASFGIPLFLFAVLCLIWIVEIQSIRISILNASQSAAKSAAEDAALIPVLNPLKLKSDIVDLIGEERIERSIISGGSSGITCMKSYMNPVTGEMHITVGYRIRLPIALFRYPTAELEESFQMRAWTGNRDSGEEGEEKEIVYIADNGIVYHEDYNCPYLQLSIQCVSSEGIENRRNKSGSKYRPCEKCVQGSVYGSVYITDYGTSYHSSLNCSGLKRSIRAVEKSQVSWMGVCSKCSD